MSDFLFRLFVWIRLLKVTEYYIKRDVCKVLNLIRTQNFLCVYINVLLLRNMSRLIHATDVKHAKVRKDKA